MIARIAMFAAIAGAVFLPCDPSAAQGPHFRPDGVDAKAWRPKTCYDQKIAAATASGTSFKGPR